MKKLLILLLTLVFAFCISACGEKAPEKLTADSETDSFSSESADVPESNSSEEKELVLKHDADYVLVAAKNKAIVINSTDDFANYSVGYIDETDSMAYAEYYTFKETVLYNAANDAQAGLMGTVDTVIIGRDAVTDLNEIVWDFATNK